MKLTKKTSRLINIIKVWLSIPIGIYAHDADHILLTSIVTLPDAAELISIFNPTDVPIDLSDYYICDDEEYYELSFLGSTCNWCLNDPTIDCEDWFGPSDGYGFNPDIVISNFLFSQINLV